MDKIYETMICKTWDLRERTGTPERWSVPYACPDWLSGTYPGHGYRESPPASQLFMGEVSLRHVTLQNWLRRVPKEAKAGRYQRSWQWRKYAHEGVWRRRPHLGTGAAQPQGPQEPDAIESASVTGVAVPTPWGTTSLLHCGSLALD